MYTHSEAFEKKQRDIADKIQLGLNQGMSQRKIAATLNVQPTTVARCVKKFGLTRHSISEPLTPDQVREIRRQRILTRFPDIESYIGKEPFAATAARYNITRQRAQQLSVELCVEPYRPDPPTYDIDPNVSMGKNAAKLGICKVTLRSYLQRNDVRIDFLANHHRRARTAACEKQRDILTAAFGTDTELHLCVLARRMGWTRDDGKVSRSAAPNAARLVKIGVLAKVGRGVYRIAPA